MAGYYKYSMSNNALDAYRDNEKPMTKWTKEDIIDAVEDLEEYEISFDVNLLKKLTAKELKETCLRYSSMHHTSKMYNYTTFYKVDVENLTNERINQIILARKVEKKEKPIPKLEYAVIEYGVWEGTRNHPKLTWVKADCILKDNWAYIIENFYGKPKRKKTDGNYIQIISKSSRKPISFNKEQTKKLKDYLIK